MNARSGANQSGPRCPYSGYRGRRQDDGHAVGRRAVVLHHGPDHGAVGVRRAAVLFHGRVRRVHGELRFHLMR